MFLESHFKTKVVMRFVVESRQSSLGRTVLCRVSEKEGDQVPPVDVPIGQKAQFYIEWKNTGTSPASMAIEDVEDDHEIGGFRVARGKAKAKTRERKRRPKVTLEDGDSDFEGFFQLQDTKSPPAPDPPVPGTPPPLGDGVPPGPVPGQV